MDDITIIALSAPEVRAVSDGLVDLLVACVENGASVSFMSPLSREKARSFWHAVAERVGQGERLLFVAKENATGSLIGTVQVILKQPENQPHRADVAKMLVHPNARRRGVGARLLAHAEQSAHSANKTLLVLDTATGGEAERLYNRMGWVRVGVIPDYALWPDGRPCSTTIFYKTI